MLAIFDKIEINNEEKISTADKEFCQRQQRLLYESLDQIDHWYQFFCTEAQQYKESHKINYKPNGSVVSTSPHYSYDELRLMYSEQEFRPFENINKLVEQSHILLGRFGRTIISYFNETYNVNVSQPKLDEEKTPMGFRPQYISYVDMVIDHLGGRGFRETAEAEVIRRFLNTVYPGSYRTMPELKGDKIIFYNVIQFDDFYYTNYKQHHIHYNSSRDLEPLCEGLALVGDGRLNGSSKIIIGFNSDYVNIQDWYELTSGEAEQMKFYKNGRIDIKFSSKAIAGECFKRLGLDNLIQI